MTRPQNKLNGCIRLAKECVLNYRETKDKRYIAIRKEAMNDARYWKTQLSA